MTKPLSCPDILIPLPGGRVESVAAMMRTAFSTSSGAYMVREDEIKCDICGDLHRTDNIPYSCETGDGI